MEIFQKHQTILEDFQDLHFHFDNFKNSIEKEFALLKEATKRNVENFQSSITLQQMYSTSLCSHVNNIYNKLVELQWQIQHHDPHMNLGNTIQIEAPDFDPDIDNISPITADWESDNRLTQGTTSLTPKSTELESECTAPAPSNHHTTLQEMDWPDAIPVEIPSQTDQLNDQRIDTQWARCNLEPTKILQLEENSEEEQYLDLDTYLMHHNTFEASERIHQDYRSRLLMLDDEKYYEEVDRAYYTYRTPAAQDYWPVNQAPGPCRTTQELMQIFGKGRGQTRREELHGHRPFSSRMRSLQSCIQRKIKKNQRLRQRYTNVQ